jgi:hypothetical protein
MPDYREDIEYGDDDGDFLCSHENDPSECQRLCKCGHPCSDHEPFLEECQADGCSCRKFEDEDDD